MVAPFTLQESVASQAVFRRADGFFRVEPGGWPPGIYVVPIDPPIPADVLVVTAVCRVITPLADTPATPVARIALSLATDNDLMKPTPIGSVSVLEKLELTDDPAWLESLPVDFDPPVAATLPAGPGQQAPPPPSGPSTVPTAGYFFPGGPTFQEPEKWIRTIVSFDHVSLRIQTDGLSRGGIAIMLMYMVSW